LRLNVQKTTEEHYSLSSEGLMLLFQELLLMDRHQIGNKILPDFPINDI